MRKKHQQAQPARSKNCEMTISLVIVMATILGATIPLYLYTASQATSQIQAIHMEIIGMRAEMRDFHGRLCAIEERNKK